MISFSGLLGDIDTYGDQLRYRRKGLVADRKPIVVWNCTRRCNLACHHCYSDSANKEYSGELSTAEAMEMIDDLAAFGVPVLLFSGGEPLLREDLFELNVYARQKGLRTVISTNGTLITPELAARIRVEGFEYIGVSLDGVGESNDRFRGKDGAFDSALSGIRNLLGVRQKVGLRFTITRQNAQELPAIFRLVEKEGINRICFYHLAYAGRGHAKNDLGHLEARLIVDWIYDWTRSLLKSGRSVEVLTVDNHADAAYLYLKLRAENPSRAAQALELLRTNGGNASGIAIANIDSRGNVHPDQFWQSVNLGSVRERPFEAIWTDMSHPVLSLLKDRKAALKGRCAKCRFLDVCNGNLRVRAESRGDLWGDDPSCYLTDEEIRNESNN